MKATHRVVKSSKTDQAESIVFALKIHPDLTFFVPIRFKKLNAAIAKYVTQGSVLVRYDKDYYVYYKEV